MHACPHECMFCIFPMLDVSFFCGFKSQRKRTQQQEVINQGTGHISRSSKKRHLQRALAGEGFFKEHTFVHCFVFQLILCLSLLFVSSR